MERQILFVLSWLYAITNVLLAMVSFNALLLLLLAVWHRHPRPPAQPYASESEWPTVSVQLPVFNERYVVERLIDAAAAMDYPRSRLLIQVLDDSTDDTAALTKTSVARHRASGCPIEYIHRDERAGYKAGALEMGMAAAPGEFIVVFDADFIPPRDYLRRMIPEFRADPKLGVVQARWEHLNPEQNILTRVVALALDLHFSVDQIARSRSGLTMNFNGSAGILRRACIEDAGGWQYDTLVEDTDLSYRLQLRGWRIGYCPDIAVPAELPGSILAFKQQQFRWAKGATQVLLKTGWKLITSKETIFRKIEGLLHLSGYIASPLMLVSLLLSLPVTLLHGYTPLNWAVLGLAAFIPPLMVLWSQIRLGRPWLKRWINYPVLFLVGIGLAVNNSAAIWEALIGRQSAFVRTPKFSSADQKKSDYALSVDWAAWVEAALALYALATGIIAVREAPLLAPFIFIYAAGYGLTAAFGFGENIRMRSLPRSSRPVKEISRR